MPRAQADAMPVRYVQGSFHGFLELRSESGSVVASGYSLQSVHGDRITAETIFHFKDGSIDDETTVYTQHRTFHLISDHHVQKGPSFSKPVDMLIDAQSGVVTERTTDKDGKEQVKTEHMTLPADLANGLIPLVVENMRPSAQGTTVEMVVLAPKPRVVKLVISNLGEEDCSVVGRVWKASHYEIKIVLGGVIGLIAPIVGKAPPNIQVWVIRGAVPTFAREQGPMYAEGPVMDIRLASPVWAGGEGWKLASQYLRRRDVLRMGCALPGVVGVERNHGWRTGFVHRAHEGSEDNRFFKSGDGKQEWIIYHANPESGQGCARRGFRSSCGARMGLPDFGPPVPLGEVLRTPAQ